MKNHNFNMLVFDLFGVLISEGHLISNTLMHLLPAGTDKRNVKTAYERYNIGEINEKDFWADIGQAENTTEYKQFKLDTNLRTNFLNSFMLDPEYGRVIAELGKTQRLSILSNCPPDWADNLSDRFQFDKHFELQIFSGHVQCKKPHADIYQILLRESGLPAQHIAFVDDRLENLQTAHELGMTTIYYQREYEDHSYQADHRIKKLSEIFSLFNGL